MIITKERNKRSGHFLRIKFKDEDEYQHLIDTLKAASQCLKQHEDGDEECVKHEDCLIGEIEKFKRVTEDEKITSVIWQENMISLFCVLYDMANLVVKDDLYEQIISNNEIIISQKDEIISNNEKIIDCLVAERDALRKQVVMHKFIIHEICNEGLVLDDEGKRIWCGQATSLDDGE